MRATGQSQTGVGVGNWVPIDPYSGGYADGIYVAVTGTVTYSVEVTPDKIFSDAVPPPTITAYPCGVAALTAATTTQCGALPYAARAIRLNVSAGTGTALLTFIQRGDR